MRKRIFNTAFPHDSKLSRADKRLHVASDELQHPSIVGEELEPTFVHEEQISGKDDCIEVPRDLLRVMLEVFERERQLQNLLPLIKESQKHILSERARTVKLLKGISSMLDICSRYHLSEVHYICAKTREASLQDSIYIMDRRLARQNEFVDALFRDLASVEDRALACTKGLLHFPDLPRIEEDLPDSECLIEGELLDKWETDLAGLQNCNEVGYPDGDGTRCNEIDCLKQQLKIIRSEAGKLAARLAEAKTNQEFRTLIEELQIKEEEIAEIAEELSLRGKPYGSTGSRIAPSMASSMAMIIKPATVIKITDRAYRLDPEPEDARYQTVEEAERAHNSTLTWIQGVEEPILKPED